MNINDTVRIKGTLAIGTITEVHPWDARVKLSGGQFVYVPHAELEPGYDLRPDIARLPNLRLATLDGECV